MRSVEVFSIAGSVLAGCLLLLPSACGSARSAERPASSRARPALEPGRSDADCTAATAFRERARAHLRAARRLAALKSFEHASALCPVRSGDAESEVRELRALFAHEGAPSYAVGIALLAQARGARDAGDAARAALLEEQAVIVLEKAAGQSLSPRVPSPGPRKTEVFFTPDSLRILERHRDGLWLRRRDSWYPEFVAGTWGNDGAREDARLSGDGRTLLVPADLAGTSEPRHGWPTAALAIDTEPGAAFGRERARIGVNGTAFGFSRDDAFLVAAEPVGKQGQGLAHEELVVADARTFASRHRILPPREGDPNARVGRLALGKRFAIAQWSGGWLTVVNLASGKTHAVRGPSTAIPDAPFSPDERFAVWGGDAKTGVHGVVVFETETGNARVTGDPSCEVSTGLLFDPASTLVAIGGESASVCLFDLESGRSSRKLRRKTLPDERNDLAIPKRFTPNGAGIYVSNVTGADQLFDVKTARLVPTELEHPLGMLHARGTNGIVVGRDGRLATLGDDMRVSRITPSPRPGGVVWSVHTRKDGGIALEFDDRWLVVDPRTGASRPHSLPRRTTLVHSDDEKLTASLDDDGALEVFSEAGGRVAGSPIPYGNLLSVERDRDALVLRGEKAEWRFSRAGGLRASVRPPAPKTPCGLARYTDPGKRFSVVSSAGADAEESCLCDRWTGARGAAFPNRTRTVDSIIVSGDGSLVALAMDPLSVFRADTNTLETLPTDAHPLRFVGKTRLITTGETTYSLQVWDLDRKRSISELKREESDHSKVFALSPDDRLLLAGRSIWDLTTQREIRRFEEPVDAAEFWSKELLAVVSGARFTLYRLPRLEPVLGMIAARDTEAALAFSFRAETPANVEGVQTFGDPAAWDTTLPCTIGNVGVPFRLCREVYGTTGLLESALTRLAQSP